MESFKLETLLGSICAIWGIEIFESVENLHAIDFVIVKLIQTAIGILTIISLIKQIKKK